MKANHPHLTIHLPTLIFAGAAVLIVLAIGLLMYQAEAGPNPPPSRQAPAVATQPPNAIPEPQPDVTRIPFTFKPDASPEAQPEMTFAFTIYDAGTAQPLPATIWVNDLKAVDDVTAYDVTLRLLKPGIQAIKIRIEAEGYHPWEKVVRFKILYSRRQDLSIWLLPLGGVEDGA